MAGEGVGSKRSPLSSGVGALGLRGARRPVDPPAARPAENESLALPAEPLAVAEGWCCARGAEARSRGSLAPRPHLRPEGCSEAASAFPLVRSLQGLRSG
ncbi:unnamed protein product [Rangifer tarandus platyrhynchus]|uniref:Uncharacterized protein n=2 Tax=Rangifer tarandus platyrhynchus TaxID=3082113 RepID=A0ABN8YX13_RANTA|nr:unnamed protein product [Rangifer tarandus platyrhynchus]